MLACHLHHFLKLLPHLTPVEIDHEKLSEGRGLFAIKSKSEKLKSGLQNGPQVPEHFDIQSLLILGILGDIIGDELGSIEVENAEEAVEKIVIEILTEESILGQGPDSTNFKFQIVSHGLHLINKFLTYWKKSEQLKAK